MQTTSKRHNNFLLTAFLVSFGYFLLIFLLDKAFV